MMGFGQGTRCSHHVIDGVIDEFVFHEVSTLAVDEMANAIDASLSKLPYPQSRPALIDSRVGTQPIAHIFLRLRELARKYPRRNATRIALILPDTSLVRVVYAFMRPLGGIVRFFKDSERDEAIAWLKASPTPKP